MPARRTRSEEARDIGITSFLMQVLIQLKSCRNIRKGHPLARGAVRILTTHHLRDYLRKAVRT